MTEFYDVYEKVLLMTGLHAYIPAIHHHIRQKRRPVEDWKAMASEAGFMLKDIRFDTFTYRFASGTALLDYAFIRLAFMPSWLEILDEPMQAMVFQLIENELNRLAAERKEISLNIPFACFLFENRQSPHKRE